MKNKLSNSSYENYMKDQLQLLSSKFSLKTYKTAHQEEWTGFERGKDVRVQIQWKGNCIWEWIMEKPFWVQRNINKEDRVWMRKHADIKLEACKKSLKRKSPAVGNALNIKKKKSKVCQTQVLFEEMKNETSS
tara:strand:+ start:768 stop:1166 length:399 start_codon:yes stop_codon:yes gene_type:complete